MNIEREKLTNWLSWLSFLVGVWLIFSPFILNYSAQTISARNEVTVGIIVAVLGFITAVWPKATGSWLPWLIGIVGLWEISAPFLLNYQGANFALGNAVISGILLVIFSVWRALSLLAPAQEKKYGPIFFSEERPQNSEKEPKQKTET